MSSDAPKMLGPFAGGAAPSFSGAFGTGGFGDDMGRFGGFGPRDILSPKKPQLQTPGGVPTLGQATDTAMSKELQDERNKRSSWSILTGGQGVLDQAHTAGPSLFGS